MAAPLVIWKQAILWPIWVLRICATLLIIVLYGIVLRAQSESTYYGYRQLSGPLIIYFLFLIAILVMDIVQIILLVKNKLTPLVFLILNSVQTGYWAGNLLMQLSGIRMGYTSAASVGVMAALFILYGALLVYAAVVYHRYRKQRKLGQYSMARDAAMNSSGDHDLPQYTGPAISYGSAPGGYSAQ